MNTIKKLAVVGGGTAGYVTALILKTRFPDMQIDVVYSKNIGIVGVGEGSTEHWKEFMQFVGIDLYTLIRETDATFKAGIMFKDWTDADYLHSVQTPIDDRLGQYRYIYGRQIGLGLPSTSMSSERTWKNTVGVNILNEKNSSPVNQYHFNTHKLNAFLSKIAVERGITLIEDEIKDLVINEHGNITTLRGEKQDYNYDFFIDSTGFRRVLISRLGAKWVSYGKYLKMKAAIAFPTEDTDNYNMWTLARAMDYGWMFRIPVWGRGGNGYIYDSDYITQDQAKAEAEAYLGHEIEIGKEFKFDPGALEKVWINNCVAVGLSANFVEPLEATSIGSSIQQAFLLMHRLTNYDQKVIDSYNNAVNDIMANIRDFVALHYVVKKNSSNFWKDIQQLELPGDLKDKLKFWKNRLPILEDFTGSKYSLFYDANFILVMHGLGLFNTDAIKQEYEMLSKGVRDNADSVLANEEKFLKETNEITHKTMISIIRNVM